MNLSKYIFLAALLFLTCAIVAQDVVFEKITTREGLSQNDVNAIYQDNQGFLWIGTHDGLNRFDGYSFKTYRVNPDSDVEGISSNLIFDIKEDAGGNLWIATSDEGICRFDVKNEVFTQFKNTPEDPDFLFSNQVITMLPAKDKSVWIGTNNGLNVLDFASGDYSRNGAVPMEIPELKSQDISDIKEDVYGRKWIATRQGIFVVTTGKSGNVVQNLFKSMNIKELILGNKWVVFTAADGVYRVTLNLESLSEIKSEKISDLNANCILRNQKGDLFLGNDHGLYILVRDAFEISKNSEVMHFAEGFEANSLSKNVVVSLFEDKSGIIWIGTNGGGLNKYNPKQKKFRHFNKTRIPGSLSYNKIRAIYQDRNQNIWIGTEGGGINFLSQSKNKNFANGWENINVNNGKEQNRVYSFIETNEYGPVEILSGVGYPGVIERIRMENNQPQKMASGIYSGVKNSVFTSVKTTDGSIWLGTYGRGNGLVRVSKSGASEQFTDIVPTDARGSISSRNIRSLLQDKRGNLWVGTDNGLNLLKAGELLKPEPEFVVFQKDNQKPGSISHNYILPVFETDDSVIWVGTMGGGLNRVLYNDDPEKISFETFTVNDGLPNNVIKGILEDEYGFLWISSNKGLTRFDVIDNLFVNFDISDGLQDYEFSELACYKLADGELLFGGVNGFNAFYPKDIFSDMSTPALALTDFHILNRSVIPGEKLNGRVVLENVINSTEEIRLKYTENSFAVYFSALHFSAPAKNVYKYILEGFDEDWIRKDATDRIAKYTNLRPGKYVFRVMASNNDGIWTNESKNLVIYITPPWYLSSLALVVYIALFLLALWFFQRYSLIRIKQKNELLMEHFEREKIQELSQMKLRFFTNISHEFRTPLTLIIGPLERLMKQGSSLSETKIAEGYKIMHRNASILLRLINQLVDFRKFEQGKMKLHVSNSNVVSFLNQVFLSFKELAESKNIEYGFVAARENIAVWFDDDKLERIMYNLLSNAFKFTKEGGKINLVIDEDAHHLIVKVEDSGVGIPAEMQQHIFERFYQAERIQNRKIGSTGIGLSFIKGLVEMHHGEITFVSEEDKGTTFTVKLKKGNQHFNDEEMRPIVREPDVSTVDYSFLEPLKLEVEQKHKIEKDKPKILLVEDNFELLTYIKDSLKGNFEVFTAENGKEGLDKLEEINPDAVVSDIMMPVMNGFDLCENIKTNEKYSHIPLILLTARSTAENRVKGYNAGADAYISKPFSMEVLEARIINLIESREMLRKKFRGTISVEPSEVTTTSIDEKFMQRTLRIVEDNISNSEFTVEQLAGDYGMSQIVLNKKLKSLTGLTAKAFIRNIRLKRAAQLFATGKYSVTDITYEVGFSDLKYFRNCFKDEFGYSPSEYIKKFRDQEE